MADGESVKLLKRPEMRYFAQLRSPSFLRWPQETRVLGDSSHDISLRAPNKQREWFMEE